MNYFPWLDRAAYEAYDWRNEPEGCEECYRKRCVCQNEDNDMTLQELKELCELIMCSDPWPVSGDTNQWNIKVMADRHARNHGYA